MCASKLTRAKWIHVDSTERRSEDVRRICQVDGRLCETPTRGNLSTGIIRPSSHLSSRRAYPPLRGITSGFTGPGTGQCTRSPRSIATLNPLHISQASALVSRRLQAPRRRARGQRGRAVQVHEAPFTSALGSVKPPFNAHRRWALGLE